MQSDQHHMVLQAEHDDKLLLNEPLMKEDVYRRVRDTIISWAHPDTNVELALSFQEAAGCEILWDLVCQAQGLHGADGAAGSGAGTCTPRCLSAIAFLPRHLTGCIRWGGVCMCVCVVVCCSASTAGDEHMADEKMQSTAAEVHVELPTPRAATLDAILAIVDDSSEYPPEAIAKAMLDNVRVQTRPNPRVGGAHPLCAPQNGAFLCDLVDLFDDLEFLEMKSALPTYFKIMKQISKCAPRHVRTCSTHQSAHLASVFEQHRHHSNIACGLGVHFVCWRDGVYVAAASRACPAVHGSVLTTQRRTQTTRICRTDRAIVNTSASTAYSSKSFPSRSPPCCSASTKRSACSCSGMCCCRELWMTRC